MRGLATYIRRNAISYLALFVALSGVAYAATKAPKVSVVSSSIKNGQVGSADLRNKGVKAADLGVPLVRQGDVAALSMDSVTCTSTPAGPCAAPLGAPFGGSVSIEAECKNEPVDGAGGDLKLVLSGFAGVDGYKVNGDGIAPLISGGATVLNESFLNNTTGSGSLWFVAEAATGRIVQVALGYAADTGGEGDMVCDIEGVAVAVTP